MIEFSSEIDFQLPQTARIGHWIEEVIIQEGFEVGELLFVFCGDEHLHKINLEFLQHDTLTDIISFDYSLGKEVSGEIYISVQRVKENAASFGTLFAEELCRVIIHGVLHLCGYKDKTQEEEREMRKKEEEALEKLGPEFLGQLGL